MTNKKNPFNLPTTPLQLPSKGWLYPEDSKLSSGVVNLLMPTAKHEDILTNRNFITDGTVIDKFLEAIIEDDINYKELLTGDKEAIMLSARILGFGSEYKFQYTEVNSGETQIVTVNLGELQEKDIDTSKFKKGLNEIDFPLPLSRKVVTVKLPTIEDQEKIDIENNSLKKINKNMSASITTYFKNCILAIDENRDPVKIREFVDAMPIGDGKSLRNFIESVKPGIIEKFDFTKSNGEVVEGLDMPMTVDFFWPK